jgi:hypothetical protein
MMTTQAQVRAAFWEAHPSFDHQAGKLAYARNGRTSTARRCAVLLSIMWTAWRAMVKSAKP